MTGRTLNVYVPNADSPDVVQLQMSGIDPYSVIVGEGPEEISHGAADRVHIFFEANRFGYSNVHTFCDRAIVAGHRCIERAPTIAQRLVLAEAVVNVGTLYLDHKRVDVHDARGLVRLSKWLDQGRYEHYGDERVWISELQPAELRASEPF